MATKATTTGALKAGVRDAALDPWPIPAEQVLEGDPQASGLLLWKSDDSTLANGIWECTPGLFTWVHADETLCLVDGKVTVTPEGGEPLEIRPGDVVFFPEGMKTEWRVEETVRKAFHLHSAAGLPF
jgi:uncharacterized cupin superfamily protein